ncbi:unnamed protein product [Lupinus luteus]|uniref:Uncharacterized protein n=1 Tax=Lupinus luteus TaxID=3873 RepID=A0AAV1X5I0_LUPLU
MYSHVNNLFTAKSESGVMGDVRRAVTNGDWFASDRYVGGSNSPQNGYGQESPRGGTEARDEGRSHRGRAGPYDRRSRVGRLSLFDRY